MDPSKVPVPTPADATASDIDERVIFALERPHAKLWHYYILSSLLAGPGFFILVLIRYFRFKTLRYRFDQEGISVSWGILFRREINLTYRRIQDIHLSSNAVERWLGLARIEIQTASGSAGAEMTIEGLLEFEVLRDFLYSRMRGTELKAETGSLPAVLTDEVARDLTVALQAVAEELRALKNRLDAREIRS